ncbi:MAG TPA: twin-arginine translocase TatA/TatE family subunit [Acidimicrobiales bacterium]|nr:twin-arginine translocase TatA/TatE family subunit [Acidimicrobiales bacterium]
MGFNLGPEKILVVLVFALVLLGPDKLPEVARKLGEWLGTARRMSGGFQSELRQVLDEPMKTFQRELSLGEQAASSPSVPPSSPAASENGAVESPTDEVAPDAPVATDELGGVAPELNEAPPQPRPAGTPNSDRGPSAAGPLPPWVFPSATSEADRPGFH